MAFVNWFGSCSECVALSLCPARSSHLLALIGLGENTVSVTVPVPEGSSTRIQITTGPMQPKVGVRLAVMPYPPMPPIWRGPRPAAGQGTPIWPQPAYIAQQVGLFLHRTCHTLMLLGLWEGCIVTFVLGCGASVLVHMFFVLMVLFADAFCGNYITKPKEEETTILVYAQEITPPYEAINEKKTLDANPVMA